MIPSRAKQLTREMQRRLLELYAIEQVADVHGFVTTDRTFVESVEGDAHRPTPEKLLIVEESGELSVSLFLDPEMLARLDAGDGLDRLTHHSVADFWNLAEGVSHFTFLAWSAAHDRPVSPLELELQAEVDKFVLAAQATGAERPNHALLPLHRLQFEHATLDPTLGREERDRYATASRYAKDYCWELAGRLAAARHDELRTELRRFYRMSRNDKFHRIAALA